MTPNPGRRTRDRQVEVGAVERVEKLAAKFHWRALPQATFTQQRNIEIINLGPAQSRRPDFPN